VNHIGLVSHGGTTTGNERYMLELAAALLRRQDGLEYTVFYTRDTVRERIAQAGLAVGFHKLLSESKWLRPSVLLPLAIYRSRVGLIHTQYSVPAFTRVPAVVTVHDVYFARQPQHYPRVQRLQLSYRVPRSLRTARRVIVPSTFTRDDLLELYGLDERKLRVIPHGVSPRFQMLSSSALVPVQEKYRLPAAFILYVGALQPRKNLVRLVMAFGGLSKDLRHTYPLIICGTKRWMYKDLERAAKPLVAEGTLRFLGYADDDDLPQLMNLATVFAFPSLSEGFGFPAVEAMRCGTCVLAGRAGSLPELVQDGGLLVNPMDVSELGAGLEQLLQSMDMRSRLSGRGRVLAEAYTWERTAEQTARVYQEAFDGV
jgi:glycosyltransferase involved in cell wall biosynthesis